MIKKTFYIALECRGDIYKRMIVRETLSDLVKYHKEWRLTERQASYRLLFYRIHFPEDSTQCQVSFYGEFN